MSLRRTPESPTPGQPAGSGKLPLHTGPDRPTAPALAQYELRCSLHAALPIGDVFRFFEDPRNLGKITPSWLHFEISEPEGIVMRPGARIDYTIHWLGLPMKWTSSIVDYDPPHVFVDEQLRGPYAYWNHRHDFFSDPRGTIIADRVHYSLPFGPLGRLAQAIIVKRQLLGIFRFRQRMVAGLLGVDCIPLEEPHFRALT